MNPLLETFTQILSTLDSIKDLNTSLSRLQEERRRIVSSQVTSMKNWIVLAICLLLTHILERTTFIAALYGIFCGQTSIASLYHLIRPTLVSGGLLTCYVTYILLYVMRLYDGSVTKTSNLISILDTTSVTANSALGVLPSSSSKTEYNNDSSLTPTTLPPMHPKRKQSSDVSSLRKRTEKTTRGIVRKISQKPTLKVPISSSSIPTRTSSPTPFAQRERKFVVPTLPDPYPSVTIAQSPEPTSTATATTTQVTHTQPRYTTSLSIDQYLSGGKGKQKVVEIPASTSSTTSKTASSSQVVDITGTMWEDDFPGITQYDECEQI